jgi:mono/diheme cytochrome c family protein
MPRFLHIAAVAAFALGLSQTRAEEASQPFSGKVQQLFATKCFDCHSAKAEEVKSGLKLDTLDDILKGGAMGAAVVPGEPENSFLLKALRYEEADYQMPPSGRLSDEDIAAVEQWIRQLSTTNSK